MFTQTHRRLFTLPGDERSLFFLSRQNLLSLPPDSRALFGLKDSRLGCQAEHDSNGGHGNVQSH